MGFGGVKIRGSVDDVVGATGWDWEGEGGGRDGALSVVGCASSRAWIFMSPHVGEGEPLAGKFEAWAGSADLCSRDGYTALMFVCFCEVVGVKLDENELAANWTLCTGALPDCELRES